MNQKKVFFLSLVASIILLMVLLPLGGCATKTKTPPTTTEPTKPVEPVKDETAVELPLKLGTKRTLWSTYYFTPLFKSSPAATYCLRDVNNKCISGKLTLDQWCMIGLQGTGRVDETTFTYANRTSSFRVPCERSFLSKTSFARSTGEIKFSVSKHKEGYGNRNNPLKAYHSIACDQKIFKFGQKFYIPAVKKVLVCEDVGGAIKGNHIDTFIGLIDLTDPENFKRKYAYAFKTMPEEFQKIIKSNKEGTFEAYEVD